MRGAWIGLLAMLVSTGVGHVATEGPEAATPTAPRPPSPDAEGQGVPTRLTEGQDAYFAANHYTSSSLLHLRRDGTFAEYDREHLFIALSDEGRWQQTPAGDLELCSHYMFEPIRVGALSVYIHPNESAALPALSAAIEERLSALPGHRDLAPRQLMPVVVRWWSADDAFGPLPAGGLVPSIMSKEERVSRQDLRALASAIRDYVAGRSGNLSTFAVRRYGDLVWLDDGGPLGKEVVEAYRERKEGPFLPGMATVGVDADAFAALLGTRQSFLYYPEMNVRIPRRDLLRDYRRWGRVAQPQCGDFSAGTLTLPDPPAAVAATLPQGEDLGFVEDEGAGPRLLLLGADRRFRRYERREDEKTVRLSDAGQWTLGADGVVRLCSPSAFRSVGRERLQLSIDQATYARLPVLLARLQAQLKASPKKASFSPKALERIAARTLPKRSSGSSECTCQALSVSGREDVTREELSAFVAALDEYLRSGSANLVEHRLWTYDTTTWLGDPTGESNADVVRTLSALGAGACVLPGVLVRVPMSAAVALRGPAPNEQTPPAGGATPLCAGFAP